MSDTQQLQLTRQRRRLREQLREHIDGEAHLRRILQLLQTMGDGYEMAIDPVTLQRSPAPLDGLRLASLKTAMDGHMKLLGKVLPDLKAVELTGEAGETLGGDGNPAQDRLVLATKLLALVRETAAEGGVPEAELPDFLR